jgi:O-antigen/teichoic acid export membrane protein
VSDRIEAPLPAAGEVSTDSITETQPPTPPEGDSAPDARRAVRLSLRTSLVVHLINTISGIELARGLGLTDRGELAAAMLWPSVVGAIATLGLEESVTYHVARARASVNRILGSALALWTVQSLAFTALTCAVIPIVLQKQGSYVIESALIYSLFVPLNMFGVTMLGVLNGLHRYERYNAVRLAIGLCVIGVQTALLALDVFSVRSIVIGLVFANLATEAIAWVLVRRSAVRPTRWERPMVKSLFAYGIRSHAGTTSNFLNQRLDQLVISAFLTASQLGLYVVGVTFTSLTALIGGSVAVATLPNVASMGEGEERVVLARRLISVTLVMSALVSLPILILAPQLIQLFFGSQFADAANITRVLSIAVVALSTNRAIEAVLRGVGRPLDAGISELVALGATVVGLAVLLPLLGLIGAAWASLLAYTTAGVWMLNRARKALDVSPFILLVPDRGAIDAIRSRLRSFRSRPAD